MLLVRCIELEGLPELIEGKTREWLPLFERTVEVNVYDDTAEIEQQRLCLVGLHWGTDSAL